MATAFPFTALPTELQLQIIQTIPRPFLNIAASETPETPTTPAAPFRRALLPTQTQSAQQALQTLSNLCLVSRHLYTLTIPLLYEEFSLGYNDPTSDHFQPQSGQRIFAFARTILSNPNLAALVKGAFIHPQLLYRIPPELNPTFSSLLAGALIDGMELHDKPHEIVIVAHMPNLERLVCAGPGWEDTIATVRPLAWKKLKSVEVVEGYGRRETVLQRLAAQLWGRKLY